MTDCGISEIDAEAMDRAWTEETMRRMLIVAGHIFTEATGNGVHADPLPLVRTKSEELCTLVYRLGIHLDATAGYNITGGD